MIQSTPLLKYRETEGTKVNRSHAAAYAFIAYQTAYFKTYHPKEFMAALMTIFGDSEDKVARYSLDCKNMGINILPPDLNRSERGFSIEENGLRFGLNSIKGVGPAVVDNILESRPFASLEDLVLRVPKRQLNKRAIEFLCLSGALDELSEDGGFENRVAIFQHLLHMRGDKDDLSARIDQFDNRMKLEEERNILGLYVSGHPLGDSAIPVAWESLSDYENVETSGVISSFKEIKTKKGDWMVMVNIDVIEGNRKFVIFPDQYASIRGQLQKDLVVKFTAYRKFNPQYNEHSLIIKRITIPKRINKHLLV